MTTENNHQHNGGFFNGFVMGALIGALLVYLLGTRRGKKILDSLMDEGLDSVEGLEDALGEFMDKSDSQKKPSSTNGIQNEQQGEVETNKPYAKKRLFKGIPRKQ